MSIEAAVQRRALNMLINGNPTSVTINRETYTAEDGTRVKADSTHGPFDISIYSNVVRTAPKTVQALVDGAKIDKVEWSAIAKEDVDIRSGANVVDTFTTNDGLFKVETVVNIQTMGEVTGKLLLLEMIT